MEIEKIEICGENGAWYKVTVQKHLKPRDKSVDNIFQLKPLRLRL